MPDVYTVSFSGSGNTVVTVFKVSTVGSISEADIITMFEALVQAAIDDTLLTSEIVVAGSVRLEQSMFFMGFIYDFCPKILFLIFLDEQNFCVVDPPTCSTEGVCSEEAEGFSCLCNAGFAGTTCGNPLNLLLFTLPYSPFPLPITPPYPLFSSNFPITPSLLIHPPS